MILLLQGHPKKPHQKWELDIVLLFHLVGILFIVALIKKVNLVRLHRRADILNIQFKRCQKRNVCLSHKYVNGTISNVMDTVFGRCGQNCSIDEAKNIWLNNFLTHYNNENRSPYGIYLHRQSLSVENEVAGLNRFIEEVTGIYPNTCFVTSSQLSDYYKLGIDLSAEQLKIFLNK